MSQRIRLSFAILLACCSFAAAEKQESWLEVRSPHFVVVTNANEKNGRRIADQFERMRSVFHVAFPKLQIDPSAPIVVLAIKDDKDFRALEPEAYLAKGSLKLGGLFLRAPEKNYVLMRVGAEGEHPYSVIYHEYTHLLTSNSEWPLWMNEGFAEYYENTDINNSDVSLGQASTENILFLRQNRLLPLRTLFAVDQNSPYYHEENKGSIFYAQSWALVHYLRTTDRLQKTQRLAEYLNLLERNEDPLTAATKAFGDLNLLQVALEDYIRGERFLYIKFEANIEVDDTAFKVQPLPPPQADAVRADFLAYNQRFSDSQALLDHVLQADPNNTLAHETKGFLAFREGHLGDAKKWYKQAVQLDSQSYLANYYYAVMAMSDSGSSAEEDAIESSLRAAIKLNPSFGPAFDRLAVFLGMHHKNLDEARMMALNAVSLEPSNVFYRVNVANVYMEMQEGKNAVDVLHAAAKLAKKPAEVQFVDNALMHAQEYEQSQQRYAEQKQQFEKATDNSSGQVVDVREGGIPKLKRRDFVPRGPHHFLIGVLKNIHCEDPVMELTVSSKGKDVAMHADNYFNLPFAALGFQPSGDLKPCSDLENRPAKVEYVESANPAVSAQLISVELHK
jgi:hypothetical protein